MGKGLDKFLNMMRLNDDNYDDDYEDTYEDDYDTDYDDDYEEDTPAPKRKSTFRKSAPVNHSESVNEKERAAATSILPKNNGKYNEK